VAFFLSALLQKTYHMGQESIQSQWDAQTAQMAKQTIAIQLDAAAKTKQLLEDKEALRNEKDIEINKLNSDVADLNKRLRQRPKRGSQGGVSNDTSTGSVPSCTGAELYQEDGLVLAGEASRADHIRLQLIECQADYQKARVACNAIK
jgi:hypothetical protein